VNEIDDLNMKSIILLTDFSDNAKNAIKFAIDAFGDGINYQLVNSFYVKTTSGSLLDINDILAKESEEELNKEKSWILKQYPDLNLKIGNFSVFGSPVDSIKKMNKMRTHDMIVMGTKGNSGMDAILFGSVAMSVIKSSLLPALSIPPEFSFSSMENVVYAADGNNTATSDSFDALKKIQSFFNSTVTVLTVDNKSTTPNTAYLDDFMPSLNHVAIKSDSITDGIIDYCQENNTNLLTILPKHTGFFNGLFHKSISKQLIQKGKLPILSLDNK